MKTVPANGQKRKSVINHRLSLLLAVGAAACVSSPAQGHDLSPEFSSRVWIENDMEVASVCLNGKELTSFRAKAGTGEAAEQADDLAAKLDDLIATKNFDPSQLLPSREGDKAALKLAGATALTFTPINGKADSQLRPFEASLKVVNGVRIGMGVTSLPNNFPDITKTGLADAGHTFSGTASWYGPHFHGHLTSDGHRFDQDGMTAAHRSLPFGTKLLVMNRRTGDSCVVEVNDRGPFVGNRVLDLSRGAARRLNMIGSGVAMVDCLVLGTTGSN